MTYCVLKINHRKHLGGVMCGRAGKNGEGKDEGEWSGKGDGRGGG